MSLTTLSALKRSLGIAASNLTEDAALEQLRLAAEAIVQSITGRNFATATYTEYHGGDGTNSLFLLNRPVQSITSVHLDTDAYFGYSSDPFPASSLLVAGVDYALVRDGQAPGIGATGKLVRLGGVWPGVGVDDALLITGNDSGVGNIKVVYIAGYDVIPWDLQRAVWQVAAEMRMTAKNGGMLQSEQLEYYMYQRGNVDTTQFGTASVRKILAAYTEIAV